MPQLLNKNIFLIWKIKLLWFTDNEYENKVQNVFAKETYVLRGIGVREKFCWGGWT